MHVPIFQTYIQRISFSQIMDPQTQHMKQGTILTFKTAISVTHFRIWQSIEDPCNMEKPDLFEIRITMARQICE